MKSLFKRSSKPWHWVTIFILAVSIAGFISSLRSHAMAPAYTIIDLGTLGGSPNQSRGYGINDCGTTVGDSIVPGQFSVAHPFYKKGATMIDLGSLGTEGTAFAVNSSGYTIGSSTALSGPHAFIWHDDNNDGVSNPGELQDIGAVAGDDIATAYGINDNNQVVGISGNNANFTERAFLWQNGVMQQISGTGTIAPSRAVSINNAGNIALWARVSSAPTHAFVLKNGTYIDLGTLDNTTPSLDSYAWQISQDGHVVGYSRIPSNDTIYHPFVWFDANNNNASDAGEMKDLGTLPGDANAYAYDINATGYVVGTSQIILPGSPSTIVNRAFIWHDDNGNGVNDSGEMKDLNGEFSDATWTTLVEARSINDGRQIIGWGTKNNGETHAFLLTPTGFVPPPCPGASPSPTPTPATTSLISVQGTGTYGGTATLSATLYSNDMPVFGKTISFTLNSTAVCGASSGVTCPATNASGIATLSGVSLAGINAGNYPAAVGASFAGDSSYASANQNGQLTVSPANQTITVNIHAPANAPYNTQFTVAATASSGLAVTYSSSGSCSNNGATFTITSGSGTCNVSFNQSGSSNFNAAGQITEMVTAQKASATIALSNLTQIFDGSPKFATASTTPPGLTVNITYSQNGNPVSSPTSLGAYNVSAVISDLNYQGSTTGTLNIVEPAPIILLETGTNNAAAVDSVTFVRGPFRVTDNFNFSGDHLTRLIIFTAPLANPDSTLKVFASGHELTVESFGSVTGVPGLSASYIVFKLDPILTGSGPIDYDLTVSLRGVTSNTATLTIIP